MARIRTIKPEFFRHYELYCLEKESGLPIRIAFAGLWTVADREGRFRWRPEELKIECLPYDKVDFSRVLDALTTRGFIIPYEANDKQFGWIPSWRHHQVINNRESPSKIPEFQGDADACLTRDPRVVNFVQGKGRERKGKEGKGTTTLTSSSTAPPQKTNILTNDEFFQSLQNNPAYQHIDLDHELGKMDAWLSTRHGRQKTRRFIINWLNKIDKPIGGGNGTKRTYKKPSGLDEWAREQGLLPQGDENNRDALPQPVVVKRPSDDDV